MTPTPFIRTQLRPKERTGLALFAKEDVESDQIARVGFGWNKAWGNSTDWTNSGSVGNIDPKIPQTETLAFAGGVLQQASAQIHTLCEAFSKVGRTHITLVNVLFGWQHPAFCQAVLDSIKLLVIRFGCRGQHQIGYKPRLLRGAYRFGHMQLIPDPLGGSFGAAAGIGIVRCRR